MCLSSCVSHMYSMNRHNSLLLNDVGQYFPLSNFEKKGLSVCSSPSSIRLGLSPYRLSRNEGPYSLGPGYSPSPGKNLVLAVFTNPGPGPG